MCGISAYIGQDAAFRALWITANQLERGRLGAGVAYTYRGRLVIRKKPDSADRFLSHACIALPQDVHAAIAHNRQPSKGDVSYRNTHPFLSCHGEFALVHNGMVFNDFTRRDLATNGHNIQGETDSELLLHRLEDLVKERMGMVDALKELVMAHYNGAVLILTKGGEVYGVRDRIYPIFIAERDGAIAIGSTMKAIRSIFRHQRRFMSPEPYQVFRIKDGVLRLYEPVEPKGLHDVWRYVYEWPL